MERLWAPWRMEFIRRPRQPDGGEGCFLCDALASDPSRDRENLVLHRGELVFTIMNKYPYNNGHLMIAPKRHGGEFGRLTPDELAEMMRAAQTWQRVIADHMSTDGFNIGLNLGRAAGCGVDDHLHLHVVPRWAGDTNFMPVLSDVHVMPQALLELYDELHAAFGEALRVQASSGAGAGPEGGAE